MPLNKSLRDTYKVMTGFQSYNVPSLHQYAFLPTNVPPSCFPLPLPHLWSYDRCFSSLFFPFLLGTMISNTLPKVYHAHHSIPFEPSVLVQNDYLQLPLSQWSLLSPKWTHPPSLCQISYRRWVILALIFTAIFKYPANDCAIVFNTSFPTITPVISKADYMA